MEQEFDLLSGRRGPGTSTTSYREHLRKMDPEFYSALEGSTDPSLLRNELLMILWGRRNALHSLYTTVEDLERVDALNCINAMECFLSPRNEALAGCSVLEGLLALLDESDSFTSYFYEDVLSILRGTLCDSGIYTKQAPEFLAKTAQDSSRMRSDYLDEIAKKCESAVHCFPTGLEPGIVRQRADNREHVLIALGGDEDDWNDYRWQMAHTFRDSASLKEVIELTVLEQESIDMAVTAGLPFGITPYYVSLMDRDSGRMRDHAIRAQVIPTRDYVESVLKAKDGGDDMDYMREGHTSPVELVTRRYPMIAILKPFNSCAQVCVYCQRNWELASQGNGDCGEERLKNSLDWFELHPQVSEVLVTGGDPMLLRDTDLMAVLDRLSQMPHVKRIRIGSRLPVVLPMRFTPSFMSIIASFHELPLRDIALVTHFEHTYEITPESLQATNAFRSRGMMVYNQQVFTMENSRRFETVALRLGLKSIGVDPYYTFNTKGKAETRWFRVPIARILQERKEEARLIPGLCRTDEPVFNIPGLGKNHLRAWQHHDLIMVTPKGERVYEFHPWEKNIALAPTYVHFDLPIGEYLDRLRLRGEDATNYSSIWYYF